MKKTASKRLLPGSAVAGVLMTGCLLAGSAAAQNSSASSGSGFLPPAAPISVDQQIRDPLGGFRFSAAGVTPTMRREKRAQVLALKDEIDRLRALDGGVLSQANQDIIARKARKLFPYGVPARL